MAKKASIEQALTQNNFATSSTSSSCFHTQFEGSLLKDELAQTDTSGISGPMSSGNSFLGDQCTVLGADFDAEMRMANTTTDRSSIPARYFLDLNAPPRTITDGISLDCPSSNFERELLTENFNAKDQPKTAHYTQEMEVTMKKIDMVTSQVCTRSMNHLREDFLSRAEQHPQSSLPPPINKESRMLTDQTEGNAK